MESTRYMECKEGSSDKFYEVNESGLQVTTRYGRCGTTGIVAVKMFASLAEAKNFADKTCAEKLKKGYELIQSGADEVDLSLTTKKSSTKCDDDGEDDDEEVDKEKSPPEAGMIRYMECKEGNSDKFYEVKVAGLKVTTRYGRCGTKGIVATKSFKTAAMAKSFADKTYREKLKKGYKVVKSSGVAVVLDKESLQMALERTFSCDRAGTGAEKCDKWHVYPLLAVSYKFLVDGGDWVDEFDGEGDIIKALKNKFRATETFGSHSSPAAKGMDIALEPRVAALEASYEYEFLNSLEAPLVDIDFDVVDAKGKRFHFKMLVNEGNADCNTGFFATVHDRITGAQVALCTSYNDSETEVRWLSDHHIAQYSPHGHVPPSGERHGTTNTIGNYKESGSAVDQLMKDYTKDALVFSGLKFTGDDSCNELEKLIPVAAQMGLNCRETFPRGLPADFQMIKVKYLRSLAPLRLLLNNDIALYIVSYFQDFAHLGNHPAASGGGEEGDGEGNDDDSE